MERWTVVHERGAAGVVHGRDLPVGVVRTVRIVEVAAPALVLGSTQTDADVDVSVASALGVDVVRRRSGGGAVLLEPGDIVWVDIEIGRDDELWDDDIGRATEWLGQVWVDALSTLGVGGAVVHEGPMRSSPLATVVCFAGLAPGEVTVDGAKVVGISQRRTRAGARFQCSVPVRWDAERHHALLAPGLTRVGADATSIAVHTFDDPAALLDAFLELLP